uniref:Uncharacterized protein n=1 Tax=Arundo donax TaxID=35708 RepID=A0A0A9A040_ARUDO
MRLEQASCHKGENETEEKKKLHFYLDEWSEREEKKYNLIQQNNALN